MTHEEELEWGRQEQRARIADLAVRTTEGLKAAQANAEARRKAAGLSRSRAADLVLAAGREMRRHAT